MGSFETIILNDEYIWEAYGIPTPSLSRFPYPEYHSSRDNISIMSEDSLEEAVDVLESAVNLLEKSPLIIKRFRGTPCLSNPRYNLYVDPGQVSFGETVDEDTRKLRRLMDYIPSLQRPVTARTLAEHVGLPEDRVMKYLRKWEERGLLSIF
jgi:hypothetical protein